MLAKRYMLSNGRIVTAVDRSIRKCDVILASV